MADFTPLPEGWSEAFDGSGNRYYFNSTTNETSWEVPKAKAGFALKRRDSRSLAADIGSPTAAVKAMNTAAGVHPAPSKLSNTVS